MEKERLKEIEDYVLDLFRRHGRQKLLATQIFDSTNQYANADMVRAFEALEMRWRFLIRYTNEGNDWIQLTAQGLSQAGMDDVGVVNAPEALPHPPKSSP